MQNDTRLKTMGLVVAFVALSLLGYLLALDISTPPPVIQHRSALNKDPVYFGVISRYTPRSIIEGYQPLMDYLTAHTPYAFSLRLSRNYLETIRQLSQGDVDFASLGNYTYIHAHRDYGVQCIAMPLNADGTLEYYDDIIVRDDSPIHSLNDLKGKSLALASRQSFSFWIAIWMLRQEGVAMSDLARYDNLSYHDLVAEKVLRGDYDAGVVKAVVEEQYKSSGLRILARSPAIPSVPLVAGPRVDSTKIVAVQRALLDLRKYILSGEISTKGWDQELAQGFQTGHDSLFNFPRSILNELE